ncbi:MULTISPECIES: HAMP domain-containing sensor histidine kinase [Brevibacterium]|jgi:two-component system sensor histidine kinase MprB|uniref:sensor histidine kinase n=1 Tax=Brevibacterium TaxID=1696 RepID=UPI001BAC6CA1|nr:HAMP domain-containing sensor histidine kinase [Brevibacterium sp. W7.2]
MRVPLRRRLGLTRALTLTVAAVIGLLLVLALLGAYWLVSRESYRSLDLTLVRSANAVVLEQRQGEEIPTTTDCRWLGAPACTEVAVTGDPVPPGGLVLPDDRAAIASGEAPPEFHTETIAGAHYRLYTAPLADRSGTVTVAYRADSVETSLQRTRWLFLALGGASVLASLLIGALVSRALLRDLRSVTSTAEAIAESRDTELRLNMPGTDELAQLGRSFDSMVAALDTSLQAQRQLVADASHELRTPLTAIKANAQLATNPQLDQRRRESAEANLHEAIDEMSGLVSDVLDLARGAEPDPFVEPLRLDAVVESAVTSLRAAWPERTIRVDVPEVVIVGSEPDLGRLAGNLVANALKYSPGAVDVTGVLCGPDGHAAAADSADSVMLRIRDEGPGVSVEHRERIFDRFYRAPDSGGQTGSGLGLAVAQQIAAAHGTRIVADWPAAGGTLMSIRFPLAAV